MGGPRDQIVQIKAQRTGDRIHDPERNVLLAGFNRRQEFYLKMRDGGQLLPRQAAIFAPDDQRNFALR